MMRRSWVFSESGMSLVEPLVAMVVISFSLLGSVGMFAAAQDGISGSAKSLEAMALAESRMERLRALPYRSLLSGNQTVNGIVLTWTVLPDRPNLGDSRGALIRVSAEWSGRGGQPRKIRLGMRKANPVFSGAAS
jgi:type II secretory pathway pseudopilin PulG